MPRPVTKRRVSPCSSTTSTAFHQPHRDPIFFLPLHAWLDGYAQLPVPVRPSRYQQPLSYRPPSLFVCLSRPNHSPQPGPALPSQPTYTYILLHAARCARAGVDSPHVQSIQTRCNMHAVPTLRRRGQMQPSSRHVCALASGQPSFTKLVWCPS